MTYEQWFFEAWHKAGGLLQPSRAGKILNLSGARITQIWNERNFPLYIYESEKPLIGWKDFLAYKAERDVKK